MALQDALTAKTRPKLPDCERPQLASQQLCKIREVLEFMFPEIVSWILLAFIPLLSSTVSFCLEQKSDWTAEAQL